MRMIWSALAIATATVSSASAQEVVYLIRHGEKELTGSDPALTDAGRTRAASWARMLEHVDLSAVVASDARRARETGGIVAEALDLPLVEVPMMDIAGVVDVLTFDHEEENVLVVAHTETIPGILRQLGATEKVEIDKDEFSSLFILYKPGSEAPGLVRLRMP